MKPALNTVLLSLLTIVCTAALAFGTLWANAMIDAVRGVKSEVIQLRTEITVQLKELDKRVSGNETTNAVQDSVLELRGLRRPLKN